MKTNLRVVRKYAKSLFQSLEQSKLEAMVQALKTAAESWEKTPQMKAFLLNPSLPMKQRLDLAKDFAQAVMPGEKILANFFELLVNNKRIAALPEIATAFEALFDEYRKLLALEITSAGALSDAEKENILSRVRTDFGGLASITWEIDPNLIGGLLIRAGDKVLDASVRGSLDQLRESLGA